MEKKLLRYSEPNKLAFIGELVGGTTFSPKMVGFPPFLKIYLTGSSGLFPLWNSGLRNQERLSRATFGNSQGTVFFPFY